MIFQYANYLVDRGHTVFCYYTKTGCHTGKLRYLANIYQLLFIRNESDGNWFDCKFELRHPVSISNFSVEDGDIVIATLWGTCDWVQKLSDNKGRKTYFVQDFETWYDDFRNKNVIKTYYMKWDKVLSVSTALHDRLLDETGLESTVICNGIPSNEIRKSERTIGENNTIFIGFPYREGEHKNCDFAISLLKDLVRDDNRIHISSYGFEKPETWPDDFDFIINPSREQLNNYYNMIDIFYVPSTYEGWGLPSLEAMAHGCAVLAHDSGAIAELGVDGENCIKLIDPHDINEIQTKITLLIDDYEMRTQIGNAAWKLVSKKYTFDIHAKEFEKELLLMLRTQK